MAEEGDIASNVFDRLTNNPELGSVINQQNAGEKVTPANIHGDNPKEEQPPKPNEIRPATVGTGGLLNKKTTDSPK